MKVKVSTVLAGAIMTGLLAVNGAKAEETKGAAQGKPDKTHGDKHGCGAGHDPKKCDGKHDGHKGHKCEGHGKDKHACKGMTEEQMKSMDDAGKKAEETH